MRHLCPHLLATFLTYLAPAAISTRVPFSISTSLFSSGSSSSPSGTRFPGSTTTIRTNVSSQIENYSSLLPVPDLSPNFSSTNGMNNKSSQWNDQSNLRLPFYLRVTATFICVILLMMGCIGNMLVPYVVLKTKDLRNSTNIFLINLSTSDILVLIVSTPTVLIELHSQPEVWFLGSFVCKLLLFSSSSFRFRLFRRYLSRNGSLSCVNCSPVSQTVS